MPADETTFYLAFAAIFLALGAYSWRLQTHARRLEARLEVLEQATTTSKSDAGETHRE